MLLPTDALAVMRRRAESDGKISPGNSRGLPEPPPPQIRYKM